MHLPAVTTLSSYNMQLASIIAGTIEMLVKYTRLNILSLLWLVNVTETDVGIVRNCVRN